MAGTSQGTSFSSEENVTVGSGCQPTTLLPTTLLRGEISPKRTNDTKN
jgi:hypothetical protein